ncbi:class II fructose-bisphosphate aldolase [Thiolapillus sp.]|uniref:class II fructose-bisphosphate aldolase n=1 Tax=Thiolapillus sp. TaxID=2017437 RepID=UPI0025F2AD8F
MPLVNMNDMLTHAYKQGYAIGAFDLVSLDFLQGILQGAENARAPVILSLAESHFSYFDFELMMPAVEAAARQASVPVAIHLDHGTTLGSAIRSINLGCNGVMVDASHLSLVENIELSSQVVSMAHGCGVPVEGELGYVPGVEGEGAECHPGKVAYTSVKEARRYAGETGIDFLAVSVGTVHGRMQGKPSLDFGRLCDINNALGIPLVIHGGTGLSDDQFRQLIANGVAKINYYTALSDTAERRILQNVRSGKADGYTSLLQGVLQAIAEETERCIRLWGGAGHAEEVLAESEAWLPVEHVIVYNADGLDDSGVQAMADKGRRVLSAIPGVREVFAGKAVKADDAYHYSWLVRFCHQAVIDSYRDHPEHLAFANQVFRPVAGDRISIDFRSLENG